jgi:hypothetical protein
MFGSDQPPNRPPNPRPSRRGLLTILAIFTVGAIFVTGLYITSRRTLPDEYKSSTPGTPPRTLRIATLDLAYDTTKSHLTTDAIYKLKPDFLLLQRVTRHDAHELAQSLDMRHAGKVQMAYALNDPISPDQPANAILARWPLYQSRAMAKGRQFGLFAESIVDNKRFLLGSWDLATDPQLAQREAQLMTESWTRTGQLPLILGGVDRGIEVGGLTNTPHLRVSDDWQFVEAATIDNTPHRIIWTDITARH